MQRPALVDLLANLQGRRALVYSLGIEGRDLARWLIARGATVVMSDTRTAAQLEAARASAPEGVERVVIGQPLADSAGFDLVAVSQSVLRHSPPVLRARSLGIPVTSQMALFLELCRGRVIGITGSSGKSTTTSLVAAMAREAGLAPIVGGNLGEALLGRLDEISPSTTVVLEISHTQLQYTERSPAIAAVTNVTPNHLDQFTWDEYVALKRHILAYQSPDAMAVLNADDPVGSELAAAVRGRLSWASMSGPRAGNGAWLEGCRVVGGLAGHVRELLDASSSRLRGRHNVANIVMAAAIADAAGIPPAAMKAAVATFPGVPHRLEVVGTAAGATWVNDSIATTPERTIAGLLSFSEPVVLLLGGREKNLPLGRLAALARKRCRAAVCFGEAASLFAGAMRAAGLLCERVENLEEAVASAAGLVQQGDIVMLSPAATSFDAYPHFEARGEAFRRLVRALPGFHQEVPPSPR